MKYDEYGYDIDRRRQAKYAHRFGYFWLPCAICGFERGGHESKEEPFIPVRGERNLFHGVCRRHPDAEREFVYVRAHVAPLSPDSEVPK